MTGRCWGSPEVSVEGDDEEVEDRGVGGQVIQGQPGVAYEVTQRPVAHQGVQGEQGHRDYPVGGAQE